MFTTELRANLEVGARALEYVDVLVRDGQDRVQVGLAVENDHCRHQLGDGRNGYHGIGVLFVENGATVLIDDRRRRRLNADTTHVLRSPRLVTEGGRTTRSRVASLARGMVLLGHGNLFLGRRQRIGTNRRERKR